MNKKMFLIIFIVVVVGGLAAWQMTKDSTKSTSVTPAEVKSVNIVESVSASGRIQPQSKVNITAEINGEILSIPVKEGEFVEAGRTLIILDTVQLRTDYEQARYSLNENNARMEGARATLDQRKEEFERQLRLHDQALTSEQAFTDAKYAHINAESSYKAAQAVAKQAQFRLEKQSDNLSKATIIAPMSGTLTLVDCEEGEIAPAQTSFTQGKTLMTISNLDVFEVEVDVDETEINKITIGQTADIEIDAFPDTSFSGSVVEIGNTAVLVGGGTQDQSTNFKVKVIFEDVGVKVRPGMSATVDITTDERENTLAVPFSAVVMRKFDLDSIIAARHSEPSGSTVVSEVQAAPREDNEMKTTAESADEDEPIEYKGVFVIRDGKAEFVEITTGIADSKNIEVTSGLNEGDSVIAGPYKVLRTVKDTDAVKAKEKKSGDE